MHPSPPTPLYCCPVQCVEAATSFYDATPAHVLEAMAEVTAITGRPYSLFDYVGHPAAERVVGAGRGRVEGKGLESGGG